MAKGDIIGKQFHVNFNLKGMVKGAKRGATQAMKDTARILEREIKAKTPVQNNKRTPYQDEYGSHGGALKKSVTVKAIGGKNPRLAVKMHDYGAYVDGGHPTASGFVTETMKSNRRAIVSRIAKQTKAEMAKAKKKTARKRKK